ncbi:3-deoxy-7-phosphoheptulonate synthase [Thermococcus sp.]
MSTKFKFSKEHNSKTVVKIGDVRIGDDFTVIAGPSVIESEEQIATIAGFLAEIGIRIIWGANFKPRTNLYPSSRQGEKILKWLRKAADEYGLFTVTEVIDTSQIEFVTKYSDIVQIETGNSQNFELLKAVGRIDNPVLLKRGKGNTIQEFLYSAEYIMSQGNEDIILCERGIKTFKGFTRSTLDISAILLLKEVSHLPIIADSSHYAGRKPLIISLAKTAYATGADGVMIEIHPHPEKVISESPQLSFNDFMVLLKELKNLGWNGLDSVVTSGEIRTGTLKLSKRVETQKKAMELDWASEVLLFELGGLGWRDWQPLERNKRL